MTDTLAVIPARGGSQELRRKNLLPIDGTPLFLRSAIAARDAGCEVIVSTDDPEIRSTAIVAGFAVHDRGPELANVPVDLVVKAACGERSGPVLLVQPTVQPITAAVLSRFLALTEHDPCSMVQPVTHQYWRDGWLTERVNRQDIVDPLYQGLGIRWWPSPDRIGEPMDTTITETGLTDIDTVQDYRSTIVPKSVALWPIADKEHGMGHLRRCLAIAERLQHHTAIFIADDLDIPARHIIEERGWSLYSYQSDRTSTAFGEVWIPGATTKSDLWILDRLDNHDMPHLPGNVITFEDASHYQADLTIDALYADGSDWAVLRPEFLAGDYQVRDKVKRVLLLFGGTDPSQLGDRLIDVTLCPTLNGVDVDWIRAGDDRSVAEAMHQADILITSAGRTVYEAAAVGIPTVVLAQNLRETTHTHLGYEHGNIYLGLGKLVSDKTILDTITNLCQNKDLRSELSLRGRPDGRGLDRIVHAVEGLLGGI